MKINKIIITILFPFFALSSLAENRVAGIELEQNFFNLPSNNLEFNAQYVEIPINYFFGKTKLKIPSSFLAKFTFFYTCMRTEDDEWIVSVLNKGYNKYDYSNVYWQNKAFTTVSFFAKYYNCCLELSAFNGGIDWNPQQGEFSIKDKIGPLLASTMYFETVDFNFSQIQLQSVEPETSLSSFNGNYPNCNFFNDFETDVVVKVIAPNNPHYDEYCAYLNGGSSLASVSTNTIDWSEYGTEIVLKAGESLVMPDSNNVITVSADMSGDSDGDGLPNAEEIFVYGTNPANIDTDCDGLNDNIEVSEQNIILHFPSGDETNTVRTMPMWFDTDSDGILDGDEVRGLHDYVANGIISHYVTNPCSDDTDNDGLTDDIDPHPLDPCTNEAANTIDTDWLNYWQDVAQKANINVADLSNPYADSDLDGINNLTEMKNKTNPIFSNGFRKIIFEPTEIHFNLSENTAITNFYLEVFSSGTVTGAIYMSSLDWQPLLEMDGFSVLWEDCPLDLVNTTLLTYRVNNYKRLKVCLILDYSKMNEAVRTQNIQVIDTRGTYSEQLSLVWETENGTTINCAPSKPVLLEPVNGLDVYLSYPVVTEVTQEYEEIAFAWTPSEDPENETINYTFNLYQDNLELVWSETISETNITLSTEHPNFKRGYYYWQVIAEDSNQNKRSSDMSSFFVNIPGDEDGDGFDDNDEIKKGYSPFDALDFPLTIVETNLFDAIVDREYFCRLKAIGGKGKVYSWLVFNENELPPGLHLNPEGELRGRPTEAGEFQLKVTVCDGKDVTSKNINLTVLPKRDGLILIPGAGKIKARE